MNTLSDFTLKFGSQPRELKIGQSFFNDADTVFHTIRYDFVPASIDPNKASAIEFGKKGEVTITMPNVEGSGTTESVFQGQRKPHQTKECVLIINNETGDMILERLNQSMIVKKARLRQEDLTRKSLALNKVPPVSTAITNGNGSHPPTISLSSTSAMSHPGKAININSNSNNISEKKPPLLVSHKAGQIPNNSAKKLSPSLPNGNSSSSVTISRPNGSSKSSSHISPPSMPVFSSSSNSNSSNKSNGGVGGIINSNNSISENNADSWKLKMPDKPLQRNSNSNNHLTAPTTNCLSELSSNESSDSEAESSSDNSSDNEEYGKGKHSAVVPLTNGSSQPRPSSVSATATAPSMPSFTAFTSIGGGTTEDLPVVEDTGKKSTASAAASLGLSEDSDDDDSSSDDEQTPNPKPHNGTTMSSSSVTTVPVVTNPKPSMPKFSQLSQDLQLSESDDSDD